MTDKISASIVLFNTDYNQLLDVINSYCPSEKRSLFIIDNSKIQNADYSFSNHNIRYYFLGKNIGFGAAHNLAIKMAINEGSKYHLVLNPDLVFDSNIIDKINDYMDKNENVVELMPRIVNACNETQYLCKLLPTPFDLILRRFMPMIPFFKKINDRYILKNCNYNEVLNVPSLSGCFMFLRLNVIKNNELYFDESFFLYCEDLDLVRRLYRLGETVYYPEVSVVHIHARESYKTTKMFLRHIYSAIKYFNKWGWFCDKERSIINRDVLSRYL
ncbi:glycosyl transferase family 2 [Spirochaetia bacterium]|nr:glycosyl transferase family 2 [Spirochaetia bacterium]